MRIGFLLSPFVLQAPGEAEADLAELNRRNFIDAIFSEDNDTLVFGAGCVIRMCEILIPFFQFSNNLSRSNIKEAGDQVTVFNSGSIEADPQVSLSHEALFFMAILCGGDYDEVSFISTIFLLLSYSHLRLDSKAADGKLHVYSHRVILQSLYF